MAKSKKSRRTIRVGVVGVGRGKGFAKAAGESMGMELVALCDTWEERLDALGKELKVATYTDYDKFLEHDMDAVVLANYFHQHAPFAVKALKAGKHVSSETTACLTLAQGVELIRAVEKSGKIYMLAENYPFSAPNQEMARLYRKGHIGKFLYGEGEYIHPMSAAIMCRLSPGENHWRNWIPSTYYSTHSLAPVMHITDTMPKVVNGFVIPYDYNDPHLVKSAHRRDVAAMIALRMDNGAVVKLLQYGLRGHGNLVRIHGNRGAMDNRGGNINISKCDFDKKKGEPCHSSYTPDFPIQHDQAKKAGHGGGDFFMNHFFADAIRKNEQPFFDVYRGVAMSAVAILAYKSALENGAPYEVPDFTKASVLRKYAQDDWSPNPADRKPGQPWPSILGDVRPSATAMKYARGVWKKMGYTGK